MKKHFKYLIPTAVLLFGCIIWLGVFAQAHNLEPNYLKETTIAIGICIDMTAFNWHEWRESSKTANSRIDVMIIFPDTTYELSYAEFKKRIAR